MKTERVVHRVDCLSDGNGREFDFDEGDFDDGVDMLMMVVYLQVEGGRVECDTRK